MTGPATLQNGMPPMCWSRALKCDSQKPVLKAAPWQRQWKLRMPTRYTAKIMWKKKNCQKRWKGPGEEKKKKEPLSAERSATFASARLESPGAATYKSGSKTTITIANRRKKDHQTVSPSVQQARLMFFVSYYTSYVSYAVKISPCLDRKSVV